MAKRKNRKERRQKPEVPSADYTDAAGNVLTLRTELSPGTIRKIGEPPSTAAASQDDAWRRRSELLFERLVVSWEIAGLPLSGERELLGRYRMASADERRQVRELLAEHLRTRYPDLDV